MGIKNKNYKNNKESNDKITRIIRIKNSDKKDRQQRPFDAPLPRPLLAALTLPAASSPMELSDSYCEMKEGDRA